MKMKKVSNKTLIFVLSFQLFVLILAFGVCSCLHSRRFSHSGSLSCYVS